MYIQKTASFEDKISMKLLETILEKMSSLTKPQKILQILLIGLVCLRGRATYTNLVNFGLDRPEFD